MTAVAPLTIRGIRACPVNVPFRQPHPTAGGMFVSAPLVLIDLLTEEGVTGTSYVFCYTSVAVGPVAALTENLAPLIKGDTVAPLAIEQKLQQRFRLLGPQGLAGIAMAGITPATRETARRPHHTVYTAWLWSGLGRVSSFEVLRALTDAAPRVKSRVRNPASFGRGADVAPGMK